LINFEQLLFPPMLLHSCLPLACLWPASGLPPAISGHCDTFSEERGNSGFTTARQSRNQKFISRRAHRERRAKIYIF